MNERSPDDHVTVVSPSLGCALRRRGALRIFAIGSACTTFGFLLAAATAPARAAKPEDVFKGQVIITKKRLASRYPSAAAFIEAIKQNRTDRVWPKEQKGNDYAVWRIEYIAFFAAPLNDYEIDLKFYDITGGGRRFVAGDAQMTRERDSRIFASDIEVAKPEFNVNRQYMMTIEKRGRVIAKTNFWLRGEAEYHSGRVEFSEEEVTGKRR